MEMARRRGRKRRKDEEEKKEDGAPLTFPSSPAVIRTS